MIRKNYLQTNLFDTLNDDSNTDVVQINELIIKYCEKIPDFWLEKLQSYNLELYEKDIKNFGIEETWKYICSFTLLHNQNIEFLDVSNFGELYEIALAINDKQHKKDNGQYYTPNDVAKVMSTWLNKLEAYNICDVACGTGKLILTYMELIGRDKAIDILQDGRLYLYDLDQTAIMICKTALLIKYGRQFEKKIHAFNCDFLNKNLHLPTNSKVISNPPYAEVKKIPDNWKFSNIQVETKELYSSFMEKIISESIASVIITPYSFIGGSKFYNLRELMNNHSGFIVSFDNVPGNIFCGRKHGIFNTNTSNSVRAAITVVDDSLIDKGFQLSPLIRFKNEERAKLLNCEYLESMLASKKQLVDNKNSLYCKCHKELQEILDAWINNSSKTLKALVINNESQINRLYIPNTCRYFATASSYQLKRTGMIKLNIKNEKMFNFIYCLINSSFAYWWWRIFDGGITYPIGLLYKLPIFDNLLSDEDHEYFAHISQEMISIEQKSIVTKLNAGAIQENIKFPENYRNKINARLLKILGFENLSPRLFDMVHKNNCFGSFDDEE